MVADAFKDSVESKAQKVKVALIQLNTQSDPEQSRTEATAIIREAAANGAGFIITPEYTNVIRESEKDSLPFCEYDDGNNTDVNHYRNLAKELGVWLDIGSLSVKIAPEKLANRQFLINPQGDIVATYDKIHMFDADLPDGKSFRESEYVQPGDTAVVADTPFGKIGMNICYDLRFPEQQKAEMMEGGATILTVPAAYSKASGQRTWETFLRARAAETGCYIVAPGQCGSYENGRDHCWGHSMVVDPWGMIVSQATEPDKPGIVYADLDPEVVKEARVAYPVEKQTLSFKFKVQAADSGIRQTPGAPVYRFQRELFQPTAA